MKIELINSEHFGYIYQYWSWSTGVLQYRSLCQASGISEAFGNVAQFHLVTGVEIPMISVSLKSVVDPNKWLATLSSKCRPLELIYLGIRNTLIKIGRLPRPEVATGTPTFSALP